MLDEIKEGIVNAYEEKTKMTRVQISKLIDAESCFNAKKAVELGFADGVLYSENQPTDNSEPVIFYRSLVTNSIISRLHNKKEKITIDVLRYRLEQLI
jgi:ATP-dependent Clp protease protease subunit